MEATSVVNLPNLTVPVPGGASGEDWVVPEPDVYEIVIADVLETRQAMFNGQIKEGKYQVRLKFQIVGGEFDGVWWRQWVGYSLHEKAFLSHVLMAIRNNRALEQGKSVDLLKYLNKPFRGVVKVDEVPSRDDPTRILKFAKIDSVMPLKTGNGRTAPEPVPAAAVAAADADDPFEDEI